jgi:uncharacterized LabA/DUF88 family protein
MIFVDGEDFTMRAEKLAKGAGIKLEAGPYYQKGSFYWFPFSYPAEVLSNAEGTLLLRTPPVRSMYYASTPGGTKGVDRVKRAIWKLGFEPKVFSSSRRASKVKGIEVSLVTDALSNAFAGNYDIAVIVAGDEAYVPLVEELKRQGKIVYVAFFSLEGGNAALQYAADMFIELDSKLLSQPGGR